MESKAETQRIIKTIYTLGIIFALNSALPTYINSAFLATFAGKSVGLIYTIASIATIIAFAPIGIILKKYGNFRTVMGLTLASLLSTLGLIFFKNPLFLTALFVILYISGTIIYFNMDIFIEKYSKNSSTGSVRGNFLSFSNMAWIVAPLITGLLLASNDYWKVYLLAAALLIPMLAILILNFRKFEDSSYRHLSITKMLSGMPAHQSTYKILMSNFLLQFFYAWMVIYTPIYLHTDIGFGWDKIGIIFTIMLLPFAILEAPLGRLADKKLGEKEILSLGFIIAGISTFAISFINGQYFYLWAFGLLATRIGASMIEIMNETYFFKKNNDNNPDLISLFRMTRPLAYVVAPVFVTVLLWFMDLRITFTVLGIIMLLGLRYSLTLKDTL